MWHTNVTVCSGLHRSKVAWGKKARVLVDQGFFMCMGEQRLSNPTDELLWVALIFGFVTVCKRKVSECKEHVQPWTETIGPDGCGLFLPASNHNHSGIRGAESSQTSGTWKQIAQHTSRGPRSHYLNGCPKKPFRQKHFKVSPGGSSGLSSLIPIFL